MSNFVPSHLDEYPPHLGEGPSHPERCHQDSRQMNLVISEIPQVVNNSVPHPLDDTLETLGEELIHPEQPQDPGERHITGVQQVVITAIRATFRIDNSIHATDLLRGLRRIPLGFHVVIKTDGAECQTSNKPVHVDQTVVEWNEPILLSCEPSSKVQISVYASFELGPMLCHGEVLGTFDSFIGELLDLSERSQPIIVQPEQEEVVSSCTSLFVTAEQCSDENDATVLCPRTTLMSDDMRALLLRTNAGHSLLARYRRTQNSGDLDQSIDHFEQALDICPMDHPCRPAALFNLATAKFVSCQANMTYPDLDIPINLFQDALHLRPIGDLDRPITQLHLAIALLPRFTKWGFQTDADVVEELLSEVLDVCHVDSHIHGAAIQISAAVTLSPNQLADQAKRCLRVDDPHALDEGISLHYSALEYCNTVHDRRGKLLSDLGVMLITRFGHRGNDEDLDEAITLQREALALQPTGHLDRSESLDNLGNQLSTRFNHRGDDKDLDEAIAFLREALALRPVGAPDRTSSLNNLAVHISTRFEHRGKDEDLDEAIALHREVLALHPVGDPDRSLSLNNLAVQISTRFDHRGNDEDLDEAIALHREALALCPVGHPDRCESLHNLAKQFFSRFNHQGGYEDLHQAITLHREALPLRPVDHPDWSSSLNHLAVQLTTRFHHQSNVEDSDEAITLQRERLASYPVGHSDRSGSLVDLANQLYTRFDHRGNNKDLDEAIALHREGLALHPDRSSSLNNFANQLSTRFQHRGNDGDLDRAIALHKEALPLRPVGHPDRSESLNNLANQLSTRFVYRGNDEDLDQAIALHKEALALRPVGHPDRPESLNNLANQFSIRFVYRDNDEDFDQAIALSGEAQALCPADADSLNAATNHLKAAVNVVPGGLLSRLRASLRWVRLADRHSHGTQLEAYATCMQLLDAYTSTIASVSSRHDAMQEFPSRLAIDAASCALRSGDVCRAVELLEQGRNIIWTQMTRLRTPLDSLQTRGDHAVALMKRFRDFSSLLDKPAASHPEGTPRVDVEAEETRYRRLVEDWNRAVEEIRKIEGFSRFLLPPLFSDFQDAAREGPIIVLIASESSCNAIIILHKRPPTNIQLPTNLQKLTNLVPALQEAIGKEASPKGNQTALIKALRELWDDVVCPVVENLDGIARRGSRIWWCPTSLFNFLPLHAAGEYRPRGKSVAQQYISSYTPSLTALIKGRASHDRSPSVPFVAIGQNHPAGALFTLDAVEPELELVRRLLPPPPTVSFSKIMSVDATKSTTLRALRDNTWFHLAAVWKQRIDEPFESTFLMRDQPLSLLDIMQMDLSRHQFAFLSACNTAVGVPTMPDEVIHLAACLQFAGVESVIGTLWGITDNTVQHLVEAFYKNMRGDGPMNPKRAAWALHQAVQSLAGNKDIPMTLDQRIVFVHIGI